MLETDGLPNTSTMNFWDSANSLPGLLSTSGCTDVEATRKTMAGGGFKTAAQVPAWIGGLDMTATSPGLLSSDSYYSDIPAGIVATVSSADPGATNGFWATLEYFTTSTGIMQETLSTPISYTGAERLRRMAGPAASPVYGRRLVADSSDLFGNSLNRPYL